MKFVYSAQVPFVVLFLVVVLGLVIASLRRSE